jgi:hypothetical protein
MKFEKTGVRKVGVISFNLMTRLKFTFSRVFNFNK